MLLVQRADEAGLDREIEVVRAGYVTSTAAGDYTRQSHTLRVALGFVLP